MAQRFTPTPRSISLPCARSLRAPVALALICLAPAFASAAAIGEIPPKGLRFGLLAGMSHADVDDPDGSTDAEIYPRLAFVGVAGLRPDRRLFGEVFYHQFESDPGVRTIGQDVHRVGAALSYQARLAGWPLEPWGGLGLAYSRDSFEERVTVAPDGFVDQRFPDRDENTFALVVNATAEWAWIRGIDLGLHVQYELPISGDVSTFTVAAVLLF
jgi:hypothetical protein